MDDTEDLRFVRRNGDPFPGRYTKAVSRMWGLLWRMFPVISDPADRDRVVEKTLSRVADYEAKHGEAQFLPGVIFKIFPQVALSMLRTNYYQPEKISLKEAKGTPRTVDAKSGELPVMRRYGVELLAMCSERERRILYLRAVRGFEYSEIALQVGVSEANVRQIFHRLKERLRRIDDAGRAKGGGS